MKKIYIILIIIVAAAMIFSVSFFKAPAKNDSQNKKVDNIKIDSSNQTNNSKIKNMNHIVTIKTNMGEIRFATYDADAPRAVSNFLTLAKKGFYDKVIFHRVIDGFMIQGGDPDGTGMGGPGYQFADELDPQTDSYKQGYKKGVVAMANAGPDTNGSQFFIMVADYPLPNQYTIFGKVISGQEVVDAIAKVKKDSNDRPLSPVIMETVTISE
ncbi:MAG: peptidylprolyl isomerase [Patescibacteria group bacterium]|nr:peptidylprolyl isomerase [Patescibacteria group bacterium]MDD5164835.1 peptidylprolyl isomerase [Patescibacteria group bacterium]MDD5534692.1 peptidylprolyl isomerase [Patescibacteria group bacterium]